MRYLLQIVCLMTAILAYSAPAVRHINVRDGLSSRQVYEIEEDSDGYIWIYTNSGLDRYDGSVFKHYTLDPGEEQNDHIQSATSMQTAADGTLVVAVKSGGIYKYDREADTFTKLYDLSRHDCLLYNFIVLPSGCLAVCTSNGLYVCDPDDGVSRMALDGKFTASATPDGNSGFYAGTDHGVYHVSPDGTGFRSRFIKGTEGLNVRTLAMSAGRLYIGSFSQGVRVLDPDAGRISRLPFDVPSLPVNAMTGYGADSLLIGVDGAGVYLVNSADGRLLHHYRDGDSADSDLSGNTVTDVHVDSHNGLWIATSHNGLNYIPSYNRAVTLVKSMGGNENSLVSDYVNVIFEDSDGDLWFGTDKGVSRYSPSQRRWWRYLQRSDYVASVVLSLGEDSRGRILAGTYGDGLSVIDKRGGTVSRMDSQLPGSNKGVGTDYVFVGCGTPDGDIWIGGINGSVTRYDISDGSYSYYDVDCVATTATDRGGRLLFGGNKGVGTYDRSRDRFEWTTTFDSIRIHYPVRALAADTSENVLWVGTQGEGLLRYDRERNTARRYTMADGLSGNTIYGLAVDRAGSLWITTETDLYRLDREGRISRLTYYLGTDRGVFNAGAMALGRSGHIMLGSAEGCYVFNPLEEYGYDETGEILLTDFLMRGASVVPGIKDSPLGCNINLSDNIRLSHSQNSFEIRFALIDMANPQRIGFEYMLHGHDRQSQHSGAAGFARYNDLAPGDYELEIKAVDLYSGKVVATRTLGITVEPPFWLSGWAKALYVLLLLAAAVFAFRMVRRIRRERRIEGQLRAYATIAHDIRTPMSMIKAPLLSIEHEDGLSESARANLRQARSGVEKTMAMLGDLLDMGRDLHRSRKLAIRQVDIRAFVRTKAEEYSSLAMFKGLALDCIVADDMPQVMTDTDKLDHILDNLVSNALKYTNSGRVTVKVSRQGRSRWKLTVADTGIGIGKSDARYILRARHRSAEAVSCDSCGIGMGLLLTRRLVRDLKGRISFESEPGQGSVFTVVLPLSYKSGVTGRPEPQAAATGYLHDVAGDESYGTESSGRSTIFVLDDDPDMLEYLRSNLSSDYDIRCSDNASTALDEIRSMNPDLVISDVMMPRLRGDELCTMLKTNVDTSHIPVILLTGLGSRHDIVAGLEARADDYIVKPFDIVVLRARISNIIKTRRELGRRILAEDCEPSQEEFANELDRRFMTRMMEIIDAHIADSEYSVNDLCGDLGMSRTSVYNKVKAISGQSPNEFMRIIRLNRAKELISSRCYNVSEVAYMVGFSDPKYFSTCFKKQFGVSPSKI
ncbi:MAG: response regulator [Muribaculaceae bacterium]|nr:response regulator [Muribaculaceae bacterium]